MDRIGIGLLKCLAQFHSLALAPENIAQQPVQLQIVERTQRMGHDHVRHEVRELIDRGFFVFVDIHDHVCRSKVANLSDVHALGAADFGHCLYVVFWMDAEPGPAYEAITYSKREEQFGDAGDEADDAGIGSRQ